MQKINNTMKLTIPKTDEIIPKTKMVKFAHMNEHGKKIAATAKNSIENLNIIFLIKYFFSIFFHSLFVLLYHYHFDLAMSI